MDDHMNIQSRRIAPSAELVAGIIPFLVLGLALTGCGIKGMPKPEGPEAVPQVRDLKAQVRANGIDLSWTIPDQLSNAPKDMRYRFSVQRSHLAWDKRNCADCPPPSIEEVQSIDPAYPQAAAVEGNTVAWTDASVAVMNAYRYQIAVIDGKGASLSVSNPVIASVYTPPSGIRNLTATTEPQGIVLRWKPPASDEQGKTLAAEAQFILERHAPGGHWEKLSSALLRGNSYMDQNVAAEESYDYRVTPVLVIDDTMIIGDPSQVRDAKSPTSLPPLPPASVWMIPAKGGMEVRWTESQGKIAGYHVYRREGKEIIRLTASPIQHPPYLDASVKRNTVYFYAVSAVSSQFDSKEGLLSKWSEIRSLNFE